MLFLSFALFLSPFPSLRCRNAKDLFRPGRQTWESAILHSRGLLENRMWQRGGQTVGKGLLTHIRISGAEKGSLLEIAVEWKGIIFKKRKNIHKMSQIK